MFLDADASILFLFPCEPHHKALRRVLYRLFIYFGCSSPPTMDIILWKANSLVEYIFIYLGMGWVFIMVIFFNSEVLSLFSCL